MNIQKDKYSIFKPYHNEHSITLTSSYDSSTIIIKHLITHNNFTYLGIRSSTDGYSSPQFTKIISDTKNEARIPFLELIYLLTCTSLASQYFNVLHKHFIPSAISQIVNTYI